MATYCTVPDVRAALTPGGVQAGDSGQTAASLEDWQIRDAIDEGEGMVNGYRAMASNQLSKTLTSGTFSDCHGGIFGVWSEVLIGEWGGMAITVDPYTLAGQDEVRIIAREFFDIGVRHGAAFTKAIQLRNV